MEKLKELLDWKTDFCVEPFSLDFLQKDFIVSNWNEEIIDVLSSFLKKNKVSKLQINIFNTNKLFFESLENVERCIFKIDARYFFPSKPKEFILRFFEDHGEKITIVFEHVTVSPQLLVDHFHFSSISSFIMHHELMNDVISLSKNLKKIYIDSLIPKEDLSGIFQHCHLHTLKINNHDYIVKIWEILSKSLKGISNYNTLKVLDIRSLSSNDDYVIDVLKRFPNLLNLRCQSRVDNAAQLLLKILDQCKSLKKLRYWGCLLNVSDNVNYPPNFALEKLDLFNLPEEVVLNLYKSCKKLRTFKWWCHLTQPTLNFDFNNLKKLSICFPIPMWHKFQTCNRLYVQRCSAIHDSLDNILNPDNFRIRELVLKDYGPFGNESKTKIVNLLKRNRLQHKKIVELCIMFLCVNRFGKRSCYALHKNIFFFLAKQVWEKKYDTDWLCN